MKCDEGHLVLENEGPFFGIFKKHRKSVFSNQIPQPVGHALAGRVCGRSDVQYCPSFRVIDQVLTLIHH